VLSSFLSIFSVMDFLDSAAHAYQCNGYAILNSVRRSDLGLRLVPNFEELLFGEQNPIDERLPAIESGILHSTQELRSPLLGGSSLYGHLDDEFAAATVCARLLTRVPSVRPRAQ
jgi:hypothetical protein